MMSVTLTSSVNRFTALAVLLACAVSMAKLSTAQDKYAVLIGVESYDPSVLSTLDYAEDDAIAMCEAFTSLGFKTKVMTGQSRVATGKPTTPEKILRVLKTQMNNCTEGDTIVISFSGHGLQYGDDKPNADGVRESYFCPEDANVNDKSTLLPVGSVIELLRQCKASRKLFLVDACRNEFAKTSGQKKAAMQLKLAAVHETKRKIPGGMTVLYSCAQDEFSYEDDALEHSVFTYFIINFLNGNAENRFYDGEKLNIDNLTRYVRKKTNEYVADNISAAGQSPVFAGVSADWSLGKFANPIKKILKRHIQWKGGERNIRRIRSFVSKSKHTIVNQFGQFEYFQEFKLKGQRYAFTNFLNGEVYSKSAQTAESGWFQETGQAPINLDRLESEYSWILTHPAGPIKLLEHCEEMELLGEQQKNGRNVDVVWLKHDDKNYLKFFFGKDGSLYDIEYAFGGSKTESQLSDYRVVDGYRERFRLEGTSTEDGQTYSQVGQITEYKLNQQIDDRVFDPPANLAKRVVPNKAAFDIDAMLRDYRMFKQEYSQPYVQYFQGLAVDVQFHKGNEQTIIIDIRMAANVPDGTNLTAVRQLIPQLKRELVTNLDSDERAAMNAGLVYKIKFTAPNGYVPIEFSISRNDL